MKKYKNYYWVIQKLVNTAATSMKCIVTLMIHKGCRQSAESLGNHFFLELIFSSKMSLIPFLI